jgi:hypothetical protein
MQFSKSELDYYLYLYAIPADQKTEGENLHEHKLFRMRVELHLPEGALDAALNLWHARAWEVDSWERT